MKIVIKERNKGNLEKVKRLLKCVFVDIMSKREIEELIKEIKKESEEKKMLSLGERIVIQMRKEGKAEGKAEGKEEGRVEERRKIAIKMLNKRIPVNTIEEITQLKETEVKQLQKQMAM